MWVLILIVLTGSGDFIPYEQGVYDSWKECHDVKTALIKEMGGQYRATCVEW